MYIRTLHVDHLKRLRDFKLDFTDEKGKPRMWTVLIGENGTAKTTILQAIALAAAGSKQVNTIAGPIVQHIRDQRENEPMTIDAVFDFTPLSDGPSIHPLAPKGSSRGLQLQSQVFLEAGAAISLDATAHYIDAKTKKTITTSKRRGKPRDPLDDARSENRSLWFVAGYGISRLLPDSIFIPPLTRPSIDRMEPLFSPTWMMASMSFINRFNEKDIDEGRKPGTTAGIFVQMLNNAIELGGNDLAPGIRKLEPRGALGERQFRSFAGTDRFYQTIGARNEPEPIAGIALSHGYQSTFAWIADLIGHVLLESNIEVKSLQVMEGLVLIDEIDAYLHPRWQATLISALRRIFPNMQFVATTHSPAVLAGVAPDEIVRLDVNEETGNVEQKRWESYDGSKEVPGPDPRAMTGSEIYRAWFDVDRLTPNPHGESLRRYLVLADDPFRSSADNAELRKLKQELDEARIDPGVRPVRQKKSP
ncbi:MAG TPA: AAA family ATPase [Polyangium sp.]|nr:AAA family ATPase [Polyangium sp.]